MYFNTIQAWNQLFSRQQLFKFYKEKNTHFQCTLRSILMARVRSLVYTLSLLSEFVPLWYSLSYSPKWNEITFSEFKSEKKTWRRREKTTIVAERECTEDKRKKCISALLFRALNENNSQSQKTIYLPLFSIEFGSPVAAMISVHRRFKRNRCNYFRIVYFQSFCLFFVDFVLFLSFIFLANWLNFINLLFAFFTFANRHICLCISFFILSRPITSAKL